MTAAVAGAVLVGWSVGAGAQALVSSPVQFGIVGGTTVPVGNLDDIATSGWHAGVLMNIGLPLVPLGFRVDGVWHETGTKTFGDGNSAKARIIAGTLDATYALGAVPILKPYLIGGVGVYNVKFTNTAVPHIGSGDSESETRFGINAGIGLRVQLTGFSTFIEARWHDIFTTGNSQQMIPLSVGITF